MHTAAPLSTLHAVLTEATELQERFRAGFLTGTDLDAAELERELRIVDLPAGVNPDDLELLVVIARSVKNAATSALNGDYPSATVAEVELIVAAARLDERWSVA